MRQPLPIIVCVVLLIAIAAIVLPLFGALL